MVPGQGYMGSDLGFVDADGMGSACVCGTTTMVTTIKDKLKELENTVVSVKTRREFHKLRKIYTEAGWRGFGEYAWLNYGRNLCVDVEKDSLFADREFHKGKGFKIISFQEFLKIQGISKSKTKLTTKITKMNKTLKRVLSVNLRAIYKADYIDGDLEMTEKGKNVLFSILLQEYEQKLADEANEELEENKKK